MLKSLPSMLCTSKLHPFSLGNFTYHWDLMIIRVTSVEWTWLGLEWPLAFYVALYTGDNVMHHCCLVSHLRTLYTLVLLKLLVFKS